jgi:hypothetical protein
MTEIDRARGKNERDAMSEYAVKALSPDTWDAFAQRQNDTTVSLG